MAIDLGSLRDSELLARYEEELFLLDMRVKSSERGLAMLYNIIVERGLNIDGACQRAINRVIEYEAKMQALSSNLSAVPDVQQFKDKHVIKPKKKDCGVPTFIDNFNPAVDVMRKFLSRVQDYSYMTVSGDSMINAGLNDGDIIIIDKRRTARNNDLVAVQVNGAQMVKRLSQLNGSTVLISENPDYDNMEITEFMDLSVMGTVAGKIRFDI